MKKFKNLKTGIVEVVTNPKVIEQMEKHTEAYELVEDKKDTKKATKE